MVAETQTENPNTAAVVWTTPRLVLNQQQAKKRTAGRGKSVLSARLLGQVWPVRCSNRHYSLASAPQTGNIPGTPAVMPAPPALLRVKLEPQKKPALYPGHRQYSTGIAGHLLTGWFGVVTSTEEPRPNHGRVAIRVRA